MHHDNRLRTRVNIHFDVSILLGEEVIRTKIINLSLNGILCISNPAFQNNALCKVIISLSDDLQIVVDSKISRVGERESAISFTCMDEESFIHLKKLVQHNVYDADSIDKELHKQAFHSKK